MHNHFNTLSEEIKLLFTPLVYVWCDDMGFIYKVL